MVGGNMFLDVDNIFGNFESFFYLINKWLERLENELWNFLEDFNMIEKMVKNFLCIELEVRV